MRASSQPSSRSQRHNLDAAVKRRGVQRHYGQVPPRRTAPGLLNEPRSEKSGRFFYGIISNPRRKTSAGPFAALAAKVILHLRAVLLFYSPCALAKRISPGETGYHCRRQIELKKALAIASAFSWPARRDSNPRPSESESAAISSFATGGCADIIAQNKSISKCD